MKDTLTDANFPRTADQRVYHLGLRPGEVANRIVTVGTPSRARLIAELFDKSFKPFELYSERGFLTITSRYMDVPVSVVSIGMGGPNMDFFVREIRECLRGDMVVVRLGSCGALIDVPVGSVVVPRAGEPAYRITKPVSADQALHERLVSTLEAAKPADWKIPVLPGTINASADSFYSSQGRQTSFPDHNSDLIEQLLASTKDLATLEMETFHLYHLAACWTGRTATLKSKGTAPLTAGPVEPVLSGSPSAAQPALGDSSWNSVIRAAGVQMVFASRLSQDFITPEQVIQLETWTGKGVLDGLISFEIPAERLDTDRGSVWERP